ncbi:hypothetical protein HELRODRAFT_84466, partial [Helobdella robusta]|uniref:Citrate transporter-like domain-containing protein n=1 Tax=Helobdella robusta TaxID=6412 RepID=T1G5J0_HELRO
TKCLYVLLLMISYWLTESLPLPITSLLPMVLFPAFGIMKGKKIAMFYISDASMTCAGGLMLSLAIEKSNLHGRLGLAILAFLGSNPTRILLAFITIGWFFSMWINGVALITLLMPFVDAVLCQYKRGSFMIGWFLND